MFSYIADPHELRERAAAVIRGIEEGWLRFGGASPYPLARAADPHRDLQGRSTQGAHLLPNPHHATQSFPGLGFGLLVAGQLIIFGHT